MDWWIVDGRKGEKVDQEQNPFKRCEKIDIEGGTSVVSEKD